MSLRPPIAATPSPTEHHGPSGRDAVDRSETADLQIPTEFTPARAGEYEFHYGMGMLRRNVLARCGGR
jgi:hypothetical protein